MKKIIYPVISAITILGLVACEEAATPQQEPQAEQKMVDAAIPKQEVPVVPRYSSWTCPANPGKAPSGDLTATRIETANSRRTEPGLYEGPVWLNGALYFSDFTFQEGFPSRVQRLNADGSMETAIENSGTNGLALDSEGFLIGGVHADKTISRFDLQSGEREKIVGEYQDNPFNSPNDLTEARDGTIYFTDPDFQRSAAPGGQEKTQVFRVSASGSVMVVDDSISNPNGVSLSPAQDTLYVAGGGEKGFLRAYPIVDGQPGEGKNLVEGIQVPDGMAIDCLGNIYVTEHTAQRVRVFTPAGEHLATISVDANITNAAFGGAAGKTLYLTGAGAVWSIDLDVAGFPY
ncbi:SMP-30/gluconolactonase/LRE family protein [Cellvibrio sp. PSBB006]|uniref:SMP-30/gluconolactonase/LRE family protein n=1 Tax=Cellvibrio sp. PSBB006 TaxID=1987723 RepID=UPI001E32B4D6|nr:SMP-30/gluconolactonase/LRE family protein [Cellvibrio sp. PSBB006]